MVCVSECLCEFGRGCGDLCWRASAECPRLIAAVRAPR